MDGMNCLNKNFKEGWNANRRLVLNSPDPIVPIFGTSGAKVTEWVSRQSRKRTM
nr:Ycf15 [Lumnitzera racemosa]